MRVKIPSSLSLIPPSVSMDTLPPEIRRMVYARCVSIRALGLLYANKRFYHEFIPFLREDFVLAFHINPSSSSSGAKIINPDNSPWGNNSTIDAVSPHAEYGILDRMPIDSFKAIRILIDAPDVNDPGQLFRAWLQSSGLVTALLPRWASDAVPKTEADIIIPEGRLSARLPPLTIQVRNTKFTKWHSGGRWNRSAPWYGHWDSVTKTPSIERSSSTSADCDLETILTPLSRIRYAETVAVILPDDAPSVKHTDNFLSALASSCVQKRSFGLNDYEEAGPQLDDDDDDALAFEGALHLWLDYLLDNMSGPTAAILRRDRFKFWCSGYECQMGQRFYGEWDGV